MKPYNINFKEYCKDCPYLITDETQSWICDLEKNTYCADKYLDCMCNDE